MNNEQAVTGTRPALAATSRRFAFPSQTAFLSQAAHLEEAGPPRAPALVCMLGFVFVAVAIIAGMLIQIDVVTSSGGSIVATDGNAVIQSFDGGIVDRIEVQEGQIVEAGDVLVKLSDPDGEAQLNRLTLREAALFAQTRRLQALVGMPFIESMEMSNRVAAIADEQLEILDLGTEALISEQLFVQAEIDRRSTALQNARNLEKRAGSRLSLTQEKLSKDRALFTKGLLPKTKFLETEQEVIDARFELTEIQGQIDDAEASLAESKRRLENVVASRKQTQGDQLSSTLIELNETRQQIVTMRQRLERAVIKAGARGIIMELKVQHRGQTVAPGAQVAELVPIDGGLTAQARLTPSEISHVRPGQPVRIAIDGIEPHRHGYLEGDISAISPSTFVDENGLPYYRALIDLENNHLGDLPLVPGMTIQAQAITGQRTILEYLLKPIYRAWQTAFRER